MPAAVEDKISALYVRGFPGELHRKLKSLAMRQGKTLQDLVTEVLQSYVETQESQNGMPKLIEPQKPTLVVDKDLLERLQKFADNLGVDESEAIDILLSFWERRHK